MASSERAAYLAWQTRRPLGPEVAILTAAAIYGTTFTVVQDAVGDATPVAFSLIRHVIAAAVLVPFAVVRQRRWSRGEARVDGNRALARSVVVFGVIGFLGYVFQNAGREHTTT